MYDATRRLHQFHLVPHVIDVMVRVGAVSYLVKLLNMKHMEQCCHVKRQGETTDTSKMEVITKHQLYALQYEVILCIASVIIANSTFKLYIMETDFITRVEHLINSDADEVLRRLCVLIIFDFFKV